MSAHKISLRVKLLTSFAVFAMIALSMGFLGYASLKQVSSTYSTITSKYTPSLNRTSHMNFISAKMMIAMQSLFWNIDDPEAVEREINFYTDLSNEFESTRQQELSQNPVGDIKKSLDQTSNVWKEVGGQVEQMIAWIQTRDAAERSKALRMFNTDFGTSMKKLNRVLADLLEAQNNAVVEHTDIAETLVASRNRSIVVLLGIGALFTFLIGYLIAQNLGSLVRSISDISDKLRARSERLTAAANQLSTSSKELSDGSSEGATSLEKTVSSLRDLSEMVSSNSNNAAKAAVLAKACSESGTKSESHTVSLNQAMATMKQSSKKIAEIVDLIDDIAFQTNLLALNAAVEAARAGEQGRGFAVVAEAVRGLALRSATAAKEIHQLIKANIESTENGARMAEESATSFKSIVVSVKETAVLNGEIASASHQQSDGLVQIGRAMNQLDQITRQTATTAEEAASSSIQLTSEAEALNATVYQLTALVGGAQPQQRKAVAKDFAQSNAG